MRGATCSDDAFLHVPRRSLADSYHLPGGPDFSQSLLENEIAVFVDGHEIPRPADLASDEPFYVLVYSSPGMHPGDLHKLKVVYPDALRERIKGVDEQRKHAVFFSTQGKRSKADEIAGSDFDGDEFGVIAYQPLVNLFVSPSPPYFSTNPLLAEKMPRSTARFFRQQDEETRKKASAAASTSAIVSASSSALPVPTPILSAVTDGSLEARPSASLRSAAGHEAQIRSEDQRRRDAQTDRALVANYLMARFRTNALLGTTGNMWMVFADKNGAACWQCILLDHLYRHALDTLPPAQLSSSYLPPLPPELKDNKVCSAIERRSAHTQPSQRLTKPPTFDSRPLQWPEHMRDKAHEKDTRAAARSGNGGKPHTTTLRPSRSSLLGKLYHQPDRLCDKMCGQAEREDILWIRQDPHLSTRIFQPSEAAISSSAPSGHMLANKFYVEQWKARISDYLARNQRLRGESADGDIDENDPYWAKWNALIDEVRELLAIGLATVLWTDPWIPIASIPIASIPSCLLAALCPCTAAVPHLPRTGALLGMGKGLQSAGLLRVGGWAVRGSLRRRQWHFVLSALEERYQGQICVAPGGGDAPCNEKGGQETAARGVLTHRHRRVRVQPRWRARDAHNRRLRAYVEGLRDCVRYPYSRGDACTIAPPSSPSRDHKAAALPALSRQRSPSVMYEFVEVISAASTRNQSDASVGGRVGEVKVIFWYAYEFPNYVSNE